MEEPGLEPGEDECLRGVCLEPAGSREYVQLCCDPYVEAPGLKPGEEEGLRGPWHGGGGVPSGIEPAGLCQ